MEEYFRNQATELLRKTRYLEAAIDALRNQIRILDLELTGCRTSSFDGVGVRGSGNAAEERLTKLLTRKGEYESRLRALTAECAQISKAYSMLSPYQRDLLDAFFVRGEKNCAERLSRRYFKERSALYRDRKKALEAFALALYGAIPC